MHTRPVIIPIEHASGIIRWGDTVFYTDPVGAALFAGQPAADIILLTDIHHDHLDEDTLTAISGSSVLIGTQAVKDQLSVELAARVRVLANDESLDIDGFRITATPMYNIPGSASEKYHSKGRGNGYLIERDSFKLYLAGDTAGTPEMRALTAVDLAIVPMNLPYTMSVEEAADAVLAFKPRQVYPYHYRGPDGLADVAKFKSLVNAGNPDIEVVLAEWYPNGINR